LEISHCVYLYLLTHTHTYTHTYAFTDARVIITSIFTTLTGKCEVSEKVLAKGENVSTEWPPFDDLVRNILFTKVLNTIACEVALGSSCMSASYWIRKGFIRFSKQLPQISVTVHTWLPLHVRFFCWLLNSITTYAEEGTKIRHSTLKRNTVHIIFVGKFAQSRNRLWIKT
jgi:hypothetical protein